MLLLCLAIILVLGILLYEYVPVSKTIPNEVSYTTPEEVKEELLTSSDVDENQIVMTYEIDSTDLNNYKKIQKYKPGKAVDLMLVLVKHLDKIQLQVQIHQMAVILQAVQIHHKVQIIQQHQVENFFKIQEQNNF